MEGIILNEENFVEMFNLGMFANSKSNGANINKVEYRKRLGKLIKKKQTGF